MRPNHQLDSNQSKENQHEESELLTSSNAHNQTSLKSNYQNPQKKKLCPLALWLGLIFFLLFAFILYRYATLQYGHPTKFHSNSSNNESHPNSENIPKSPNNLDQSQLHNSQNQKQTSPSQINISQKQKTFQSPFDPFPAPYTIWLFSKTLNQDYTHNIEHYSSPQKSTVKRVNIQNYKEIIQSQKVLKTLAKLKDLNLNEFQLEKFMDQLVLFTLLSQNGGLIFGGDLILTKNLEETQIMQKIQQEKHNFAMFFYANSPFGAQTDQKPLLQFNFQNYFIAAGKNFHFLKELVEKMTSALEQEIDQESPSFENLITRYQAALNQLVEQKHQTYSANNQKMTFLEHLKFFSLGSISQLNIAQPYLFNVSEPSQFQYLSTYPEQAFEALFGPLNPIVELPLKPYTSKMTQIKVSTQNPVLPDSFLYRHMMFFSSTYSTVKPLQFEPNSQKYYPWKLPKTIWTFINKIDQKSPLHDYFLSNLIARSKDSQYQLLVLTEETIQAVFDGKELHQIFSVFKNDQNSQNQVKNEQTLSKLVKWYILKNYGGIFIDFGYFLLQNLNWVTRIKSNEHVFNSFEKQPEIFMFHDHQKVKQWSINLNSGTKVSQNLNYRTNGFIAATKNSKFVTEQIQHLLKAHRNLLNEETSKGKVQGQQKQEKSPRVWSMSSFLSGDKIDLVMKGQHFSCFDFKDSFLAFKSKYGSIGFVSELNTEASREELNMKIPELEQDSIFGPFFIRSTVDKKEIEKVKSLKEVSLSVQKLKK